MLVVLGAWRARASARAVREPPSLTADSFAGTTSADRREGTALVTWRLFTAASLLLVCYLGLVGVSRIMADPEIPLDQRILAPALLLLMTMAATGLTLWWRNTHLQVARVAVAAALMSWWYAAAMVTRENAQYALGWGSDLAGEQWRESEVLAWARSDGAGAPLYSNWPAAVYFYLHRPAHEIPQESDARTMAAFADTVRVRGGRVLLFDVREHQLAPNDSVIKTRGLRTVERLRDGVILGPYAAPPSSSNSRPPRSPPQWYHPPRRKSPRDEDHAH